MTDPISHPIPRCQRGTFNGAAAEASRFGFAPCVLPFDHPRVGPGCDSGPVTTDAVQTREAA